MSTIKTINLPTRFDYSSHTEFYEHCLAVTQDANIQEVILDFSLVEYMDSSALGMLVIMHKKAQSSGKKLKISRARGTVKEVLMLANIERIIDINP